MHRCTLLSCAIVFMILGLSVCSGARPTPDGAARSSASNGTGSKGSTAQLQQHIPVIFDHDGGIEDFVAMMLLLLDPRVKVLMISYLEASSFKDTALNTTLKLLHFLNRTDVPVAASTLTPVNPLPLLYRAGTLATDVLPSLNPPGLNTQRLRQQLLKQQAGQDALTGLLLAQTAPVTVVATGPLTNIAYALKKNPAVADKISRIWWMGGTLRCPGNIFNQSNSDGSAEWNVFADPAAAGVVWDSKVPITLVPLDATNKVPITARMLHRFGEQQHSRLAQLVGNMYAPTITWVVLAPHDPYYAWDSLNAACFLAPSLCRLQQESVQVVLQGPAQGALRMSRQGNGSSNARASGAAVKAVEVLSQPKQITAAVDADAALFEEYILKVFGQ